MNWLILSKKSIGSYNSSPSITWGENKETLKLENMNTLTYKQAFDKITEAYLKGEIEPFYPEFCFCGTLCNGRDSWQNSSFRQRFHQYSWDEYGRMERALFSSMPGVIWVGNGDIDIDRHPSNNPNYETILFEGMCAALEVLKQIHIERGEIIDEVQVFTKRQLATL